MGSSTVRQTLLNTVLQISAILSTVREVQNARSFPERKTQLTMKRDITCLENMHEKNVNFHSIHYIHFDIIGITTHVQ